MNDPSSSLILYSLHMIFGDPAFAVTLTLISRQLSPLHRAIRIFGLVTDDSRTPNPSSTSSEHEENCSRDLPSIDELILNTSYSQSHLYGEAHQLLRGIFSSISSLHGTPPFIGALHALSCPICSLEQRAWKRSICPEYIVPLQSPNVPLTEGRRIL